MCLRLNIVGTSFSVLLRFAQSSAAIASSGVLFSKASLGVYVTLIRDEKDVSNNECHKETTLSNLLVKCPKNDVCT